MTEDTKKPHYQDLVSNKKATFEYEILETFEVGIVLVGTEIKSLRANGGSLQESYVTVDDKGQLLLIACNIAPYRFGSYCNHEEKRKRVLLAHKREIRKIEEAITRKGLTAVALSLYLKNGRAKVKIAICRGKKMHDKRAAIQDRDQKREVARNMKQHT